MENSALKHYPEFEPLRINGQYTDLELLVGSNPCFQINGHRLVLQQIKYFRNLIVNHDSKTTITLNDLDSSGVIAVIKYIYTGQLDVTTDSFKQILAVAKRFGLDEQINCWKIKEISEENNNMDLRAAITLYIKSNMISLARDDSFLSEAQLKALMHGVRRNQFLRFTVSKLILENEVEEILPLMSQNHSAQSFTPTNQIKPAISSEPCTTTISIRPIPEPEPPSFVRNIIRTTEIFQPQSSTPNANRFIAHFGHPFPESPIPTTSQSVHSIVQTQLPLPSQVASTSTQESQDSNTFNSQAVIKERPTSAFEQNTNSSSYAITPPLDPTDQNSAPTIRVKTDIFNQVPEKEGQLVDSSAETNDIVRRLSHCDLDIEPSPLLEAQVTQIQSTSIVKVDPIVLQSSSSLPGTSASNISPKQRKMIETLFPLGLPKQKNGPGRPFKRPPSNDLSPNPLRQNKAVRFTDPPRPNGIDRPIKRANAPEIDTRIFETATMLLFPIVKNKTKFLDAFDPKTGHIIRLHKFAESNDHACMINWDGHIYSFGGNKDKEVPSELPSTWEFSPTRNKVEIFNFKKFEPVSGPILGLSQGKRCQSVSGWNDFIFMVGGERSTPKNMVSVNTVMKYHVTKRTWYHCPNIQCARSAHDSIVLGNYLYVVGGFGAEGEIGEPLKSVRRLDLTHDRWESVEDLNVARYNLRLFSWENKIYAVGGTSTSIETDEEGPLNSVEMYDPEKKVWEFVAPMNHSRKGFGIVTTSDLIYVIGGNSAHTTLLTMESYNPRTNVWTQIPWPNKLDRSGQFSLSTTVAGEYVAQNVSAFLSIVSKKKAKLST